MAYDHDDHDQGMERGRLFDRRCYYSWTPLLMGGWEELDRAVRGGLKVWWEFFRDDQADYSIEDVVSEQVSDLADWSHSVGDLELLRDHLERILHDEYGLKPRVSRFIT